MRPTVEQLRQLVALDDLRNFTRAAAFCGISQPPFSRSIRRLEEVAGIALVAREQGRVELTPAGAELAGRARHILADLDAALQSVRELTSGRRRIRIGILEYVYALIEPLGLDTCAHLFAGRLLEPVDLGGMRPDRAVLSGDLDLAFAAGCDGEGQWAHGVAATPLHTEPMAAMVRCDHPVARLDSVGLGELADNSLVAFDRGHAPFLHDRLADALARAGGRAQLDHHVATLESMVNAIRANGAVGLVPASVRNRPLRDIAVVPFADADSPRITLMLLWRQCETQASYRAFGAWMRKAIEGRQASPSGTFEPA